MDAADRLEGDDGFAAAVKAALAAIAAGAWDEADRLAGRLAAAAPDAPPSRWIAARVALGRGDLVGARAALQALLQTGGLSDLQAAEAWLRLSEALDGLGESGPAFEAAVRGKGLQRRAFAAVADQREDAIARFRRLAAWFDACDPAPWRTAPPASEMEADGHVFLVGFPRSGTTLLEQALAGHPDVAALEEAPTLAAAHAQFMSGPSDLERLAELGPDEAQRWRDDYWREVQAHGVDPRGKLFVDKAPAGTVDLPLVAKLFPAAKVLFAIRDPRDVVLSCLRQDFRMNALTFAFTSLQTTAAAYASCMEMAQAYRRRLPLRITDVRHEALVEDFETGLGAVCAAIGLDVHPQMLDVAATAARRSVLTPSAPQIRAGLNRRGIGRWRAYADELAPVAATLAPWVARFGYPPA